MSEDKPLITEEWVAERRRQYTDPDGPFAKGGARGEAALRQFEVMVAEARLRGTLPAEPPKVLDPLEQARQNVLARDFAELPAIPEMVTTAHSAKFDALDKMTARKQAELAQATADALERDPRPEDGNFGYSAERGGRASGAERVEALVAAAEPAIRAEAEDQADVPEIMRLIRLDAALLRYYAIRGREIARRQEGRRKLGAKS
jgi:hypothetical protein